jgi:hypothetical protein
MRFSRALAFAVAAALTASSGCVHHVEAASTDLIVLGRVRTLTYESLDEFGMSGVMTARLTITRVVKGRAPSSVLTVKYIAHGDLPADQDRRFHLRRANDGIYLVCRDPRGGRGYICH